MAYTTIDDPSAHYQVEIYSGNGTDDTAQTFDGNSDLQPDLLWVKRRTDDAASNLIIDSTRGVTKYVYTDDINNAEGTDDNRILSLDSDGFTLGTNAHTNENADTYVAWSWKANGGTTSTLTAGTIDCPVQTDSTAQFSIITYTGNGVDGGTIAHGLSGTWDICLIKNRGVTDDWMFFHKKQQDDGVNTGGNLNDDGAFASSANGTARPTRGTSVIALNAASDLTTINGDGETYVCYTWKEVQGYSKFGSYTGNGNADGAFIYLGFKPAWVMTKRTDASDNWQIQDNARNPFNGGNWNKLSPDLANVESSNTNNNMDFLSNGFKLRATGVQTNADGGTYVYMAFAENPFVTSSGVPATAR